jgi:transposase
MQERLSMAEICRKYDLHPNVVNGWKKQFKENMSSVFSEPKREDTIEKERVINDLYRKTGQLEMDSEFLKKSGIKYSY